MENNLVIIIKNLVKRYPVGSDFFTALKNININVSSGEFIGLVGSSGSGKSTLLNIIGGLDTSSEGEVNVLSCDMNLTDHNNRSRIRREKMGFIFQSYNLLPVYTVYENIELPLLLNNTNSVERDKLINEAIEWVGLSDKKKSKPSALSGGECQRTAIARAIVTRPKLILADEPTANLDAKNSHQIMKILINLNEKLSTSFIFATHDDKIMNYLKRIIQLEDGMIVKDNVIKNIN